MPVPKIPKMLGGKLNRGMGAGLVGFVVALLGCQGPFLSWSVGCSFWGLVLRRISHVSTKQQNAARVDYVHLRAVIMQGGIEYRSDIFICGFD